MWQCPYLLSFFVSIPYSSGLGLERISRGKIQFYWRSLGLNPLFIRSRFGTLLISNPAFIARFINFVSIPYSSGLGLERNGSEYNKLRIWWFVSIPYSSGLGLERMIKQLLQHLLHFVSIPYSSGLGLELCHILSIEVQSMIQVSIPYSSGLGLERN